LMISARLDFASVRYLACACRKSHVRRTNA
jgi:hypothetical protein